MCLTLLERTGSDRELGTANVLEDERIHAGREEGDERRGLKYDRTGKILLVPQPSDDPNDPLVRFFSLIDRTFPPWLEVVPSGSKSAIQASSTQEQNANTTPAIHRTGPYGNATPSPPSSP